MWARSRRSTPYNNGPDQRVTIKLAAPGTITSIAVSAFKTTTASRFEALRDFTLQTSTDGVTWTTAQTGSFTFQPPRPTAPDLHLRSFKLAKPVQAGYVRFFIDSVQGETQTRAQAAELQVFATAGDDGHPHAGRARAAVHRLGDDRHRQPRGRRPHRPAECVRRDRHRVHEHVRPRRRRRRAPTAGSRAAQGLRRRHALDRGDRRATRPRPATTSTCTSSTASASCSARRRLRQPTSRARSRAGRRTCSRSSSPAPRCRSR